MTTGTSVIDWLVTQFKNAQGVDLAADRMAIQRLKEAAEKAKIELSQVQSTQINLPFITANANGPLHLDETLTRAKFQEMTSDLIERCRIPFEQALKDASVSKGDLHHVILVGGSTRMPAVLELVQSLTGKEPTRASIPTRSSPSALGPGRCARGDVKDRLDESSQRQRQFVSDASHELRSPLASIRTNVEVALRNYRSRRLARGRAARARGRPAHGRHRDELLDLARLDECRKARRSTSLPEVDLDELVLDETLRHHARDVSTTRVSAGRVHGRRAARARSSATCSTTPTATRADGGRRAAIDATAPSSSWSTTTAPASPPTTASACSTGSPGSTTGAPATPVASGSGSRS